MASRIAKVPSWELTAYRMAPLVCLTGMGVAASVGVEVDPFLFGIAAIAHWRMAVGLLKFPESWVSLSPTQALPSETKPIDGQMA